MHHHVGLRRGERALQGRLVADVRLEQPGARVEAGALQALRIEGIEVVDDRHLVAAIEQRLDQVRSDEPRAAGHQDALQAALRSESAWA